MHKIILFVIVLALLGPHSPVQAQSPDPRFGIVQTYDDLDAADELGVGFTRVKLYWDVIQPNGPDDWQPANIPDPFIEADLEAGREVIGLIARTPVWARDLDHPANAPSVPTAKDVPDMAEWHTFVTKLAEQYQGRIHHWIIWNEPDVWDAQHPGSTWNGSVQDFVDLHVTAYQAIKAVDPDLKVYLTGLTYFWDYEYQQTQYLTRMLLLLAEQPDAHAHNLFMDGAIFHLYYKPQMIYDMLSEVRYQLDSHGLPDTPIWLNETNAPPSSDLIEPPHREPRFKVTLDEQSAYIIQIHAMAFAAGVERVQLYKLFNSTEHPEDVQPFGLVRGDGSRRPAFEAYQTVIRYLSYFEEVVLMRQGEVTLVEFRRADERVVVVWNWAMTETDVVIRPTSETARLFNELGEAQSLRRTEAGYQLTLPSAECSGGECFIGGAPRLLVEPLTPPTTHAQFSVQSAVAPPSAGEGISLLAQATANGRRLVASAFALLTMLGGVVVGGWWYAARD